MLTKKQLLTLLSLGLILAALIYLVITGRGDSNIVTDPRIIYEDGRPYITAQFRNPTDTPYKNLNLHINILKSWRNLFGTARAETVEVLPGITWFFKSPIVGLEGKDIPNGSLDCRSVSPYKDGERLIINCKVSTTS